jgi:GTPase SAR1 family protein
MNGQLHSQRNLQAQLKTAQATARPKFLIELAKPTQKEFQNIFPTLLKKIKNATHSRHDNDTETQY